jgi:hypothetical protein
MSIRPINENGSREGAAQDACVTVRGNDSETVNDPTTEERREKRRRDLIKNYRGLNLLGFKNIKIDDREVLLGDAWLCRRQFNLLVAPSGQGKSVSTVQAALQWSCGQIAFGIKPMDYEVLNNEGMRILIIQAEDDDTDMKAMTKMVEKMKFTDRQRGLIAKNTLVYQIDDVSGDDFFPVLEALAEDFMPDLVIINPFNRYLGDDAKKQEKLVKWLDSLSKCMNRLSFGTLMVHHTNKTTNPGEGERQDVDWQYCFAGDPMLINRARGSIVIWATSAPGVYRFIGAKRGKKLPWQKEGNVTVRYFKHSDDEECMMWLDANCTEQASASAKPKKSQTVIVDHEKLLKMIPAAGSLPKKELQARAKSAFKCGKDPINDALTILEADGKIKTVILPKETDENGKVKTGPNPEGWTRSSTLDQLGVDEEILERE